MPTRAATAAATAAAAVAAASNMRTTRSRRVSAQPSGKENGTASLPSLPSKGKEKAAPKKTTPARGVKAKEEELFCSCRGVDDGTPMVQCGTCDEWYHFRCVQLSEDDASEIMVYVCPSCQEKTGRRTVMEWEGSEALEPIEDASTDEELTTKGPTTATEAIGKGKTQPNRAEKPAQAEESEPETEWKRRQKRRPSPAEVSESSDNESGDEYVDEGDGGGAAGTKHKRRRLNNRRIAALSSSDSDEDSKKGATSAHVRRTSTASAKTKPVSASSPQPSTLKRKQSTATATPSTTKRKRAESLSTTAMSATEDVARKYCLGKFTEMFTSIFMQYPHVQQESQGQKHVEGKEKEQEEEGGEAGEEGEHIEFNGAKTMVERKSETSEEEKTQARERAMHFAVEVEQAVFETYAEPDKYGKPSAGAKYKERFRTLTFNLQQSDRLASQEQQQSIKQAEQEALEHSILIKTTAPRAKITHKGLQDIEDLNEDSAIAKQRNERERERIARLRAVQPLAHAHSNPPSASVPPESPSYPPLLLLPLVTAQTQTQIQTASDLGHAVDSELNLGDFIHIDDEPPESTPTSGPPDLPAATTGSGSGVVGQGQQQGQQSTPITGISPFAPSKPDMPPRASFDLNALWSAPPVLPPTPKEDREEGGGEDDDEDEDGDEDGGEDGGGADLDFAMFLETKMKMKMIELTSRPDPQAIFDGLPRIWNGIISMPIDSTVSQELKVDARQIGGRRLACDSPLWRTLFPIDHLRIDGRVAVGSSAQYLLASRLNSTKELIAVAWTPVSDVDMTALKTISTFLINKDRHGLIFPWGSRGREWGRELYVIPLLSSYSLPEYIELLDDLHLPKNRNADLLIGIWVLNRGRLAILQPPPVLPPSFGLPPGPGPGQHSSVLPPALASALASILPIAGVLPLNAAPAALAAALTSNLPTSALPAPLPPPPPPPPPLLHQLPPLLPLPPQPPFTHPSPVPTSLISPSSAADLAAQVASLTPEQIQAMLITLQQQQQQQQQQHPQQQSPPPPPPPPQMPPMQKSYGGGGYDERERERSDSAARYGGGYYSRDETMRTRGGRGGGGGGRRGPGPGGVGGREDSRTGAEYRRMSDGGWSGRGRGGASPVRRGDAPPYWR
ncbi:hypothetical protein B0F90DRAFT_1910520 [Multifurca ochricompacta]|uniref:PHD-type domain-containing protein n=1 Tax=Multifurca ochricompacta TaxID=376703 RepID=A0AAD4QRK4_9AGAM|nr:hypothetical protein B0F90DRAFT_1910520 [Multifurca ochricompacta]